MRLLEKAKRNWTKSCEMHFSMQPKSLVFMFRTFLSPSSILWTEKLNNIAASPRIIPVTTAAAIVKAEGKNSRDAMQSEGV